MFQYLLPKVDVFQKDNFSNLDIFGYIIEITKWFVGIGIAYVELIKTLPFDKLTSLKIIFDQFKNDIIVSCLVHDYSEILDVIEDLSEIIVKDYDVLITTNLKVPLLYYKF